MGGVAALARAAGHKVTGCDRNMYPPMSTQLKELGIDIHEGVDADQLNDVQKLPLVKRAMDLFDATVVDVKDHDADGD